MSFIAPNTNNTLPRFKCKEKINENNNYYISITVQNFYSRIIFNNEDFVENSNA